MEATILLPLREAQMIGLACQLTPSGKQARLQALYFRSGRFGYSRELRESTYLGNRRAARPRLGCTLGRRAHAVNR